MTVDPETSQTYLPKGDTGDVIRLGVSRCLLGENVRYDGGHKLDRYLTGILGRHVEFVPVCPEVECGLPVPREALRLVGDPAVPRLVTQKTGQDFTLQMQQWGRSRLDALEAENICGYVFKSKSPSSGMSRVKVYTGNGGVSRAGAGIWAAMVMQRFPHMPFEDEGRLNDLVLRENFIERVFVYKRLRELLTHHWSHAGLVRFHTRHKLLLMAHSPKHYTLLGRLVAQAGDHPDMERLFREYVTLLMQALELKATTKKNVNVLQHLAGYFKKQLDKDERQELQELIHQYAKGYLPLIVPITLVNHYVRKYRQPYLREQYHLNPHPVELMLRNHV